MQRATSRARSVPDDLYDRIAHNLFSINMVWMLIAGFLVMFMQAGFAMVETGLCRAKNAGAHDGHEHDDLSARLHRVLGLRFRARLGQLVQRAGGPGLVSVAWTGHCRCSTRLGIGCGSERSSASSHTA